MPNIIENNKVIHIKHADNSPQTHKNETRKTHHENKPSPPSPKHKKKPIHTRLTFDHKQITKQRKLMNLQHKRYK
jgi:hypothetical protein